MGTLQRDLNVASDFLGFIAKTEAEVAMAIANPDGRILLITKAFYPEGVYRIPTGKLKTGEDPDSALRRELVEETGFELADHDCLGVIRYTFHSGADIRTFTSHLYLIHAEGEPESRDEGEQITGFRWIPISDLSAVTDQLRNLSDRWADWGRFRAIAHDFVANYAAGTA